jgi:hypothetical protein
MITGDDAARDEAVGRMMEMLSQARGQSARLDQLR